MDNQIEGVALKGKASHVLIGKAIYLDAKFPAGNISGFNQKFRSGDGSAEIVRLIEMENMKVLEFRLDPLETPEQHPNALRHVTDSTKVSFPLIEPTSFPRTQSPSLRQFISNDRLLCESLSVAAGAAVPVYSAPAENSIHEGKGSRGVLGMMTRAGLS